MGILLDSVTLMTVILFTFSLAVFYLFARFTVKLIRQHKNIHGLLYALEEEEKRKQ